MAWTKEYSLNPTSFGDYWSISTAFIPIEFLADFSWNAEQSRLWNAPIPTEQWDKDLVGTDGNVVVWTYTTPIWSDTTLWTTSEWTKES